jgi:hypothetical protein
MLSLHLHKVLLSQIKVALGIRVSFLFCVFSEDRWVRSLPVPVHHLLPQPILPIILVLVVTTSTGTVGQKLNKPGQTTKH